jgi:hypothetical protein
MFPLWSPKFNRRLLPRNLFGAALSDEKKKESGHSDLTSSDNPGIFDFTDDDSHAKVTARIVDQEVENQETHQSVAAAASTNNDGNNNTKDNFNKPTEIEELNQSLDVAAFVDDSNNIILEDTFMNIAALASVDDTEEIFFDDTVASKSTKEDVKENYRY